MILKHVLNHMKVSNTLAKNIIKITIHVDVVNPIDVKPEETHAHC